jgi:hypothetical protein
VEKDITRWVKTISKKRDELGGFAICPFARKALKEKKIFWSFIGYEPSAYISRYMEMMIEDYEVVLFYNLKKNLTDQDCIELINKLNKKFPNIVFLKDHPDNPGFINGINTSNGEYPVIIAQPKGKLQEARLALQKTKYYDSWSDDYKKEILSYGSE